MVPQHLEGVKEHKLYFIEKTENEVRKRLTTEIRYWNHRGAQLRENENRGKRHRNLNSAKAWKRAEDLQARLDTRLRELAEERNISALPPVVIGGALVIPARMLASHKPPDFEDEPEQSAEKKKRVELLAMEAVMEAERKLGFEPRDICMEYKGYDIESRKPDGGEFRFIEVKGRAKESKTVTVSKNEILVGLNKPDGFILAVVFIEDDQAEQPIYIREPFDTEPGFSVQSVTFKLNKLIPKGGAPS